MASTRNINTQGNYDLEQRSFREHLNYYQFQNYGIPSVAYFPGDGIVSSKMSPNVLTANWTDVESGLYGIGATNLTDPTKFKLAPEFIPHATLNIYQKPAVIQPKPLVIENNNHFSRFI